MRSSILVLFMFCISYDSNAFTDAAQLAQLVFTSAKQLNELERLTTNAEKHTERAVKMTEVAEDKVYLADRFKTWAEDIQEYNMHDHGEGLEGLIGNVRNFKMSKEDINDMYRELSREEILAERSIEKTEKSRSKDKLLLGMYKKQGLRGVNATNQALGAIKTNTSANVYETAKGNAIAKEQLTKMEKNYLLLVKQEKRRIAEKARQEEAWGTQEKGIFRRGL